MALALIPEVVEVGLLALLQVFNNVNICCPGPCCLSKYALPFLVPAPEDGSQGQGSTLPLSYAPTLTARFSSS